MSRARALALGTLAVGLIDIADAFVFFGLRGVSPARLLRGIAAGLLGREAVDGGAGTAALGLAIHFFIAFAVVLVYQLAARWLPALARRPLLFGPPYGLAVYAFMSLVVLPLAAVRYGRPDAVQVANQLLIHALGVGLPAALAASRVSARGPGAQGRSRVGRAGADAGSPVEP